jgi:hypothetical protein
VLEACDQLKQPCPGHSEVFAQLPGLADKFRDLFEEVRKSDLGVSLESVTAIYLPAMAAILQPQGQALPAGFDPNAPLMEVRMELAGFSTDALPDTTVQVPADYSAASIGDLIQAQHAAVRVAAPPTPAMSSQKPPPARPQASGSRFVTPAGLYRGGAPRENRRQSILVDCRRCERQSPKRPGGSVPRSRSRSRGHRSRPRVEVPARSQRR